MWRFRAATALVSEKKYCYHYRYHNRLIHTAAEEYHYCNILRI